MGKYKILVVDDEESLCEILKFNLELEGYEVDVAYSAEQALAMHPERYSLLLLDVMMGEISGFKMARMLKSSPETAAVPIIFCTAKDTEDDTVAGLNLGADDYISKPFDARSDGPGTERAAPRKPGRRRKPSVFEGLCLDLQSKVCRVNGQEVPLTVKGVRNPHPAPFPPRGDLLARTDPRPGLEQRSDRPGPHDRRKHHAPAQENRALRLASGDPPGLRLWI